MMKHLGSHKHKSRGRSQHHKLNEDQQEKEPTENIREHGSDEMERAERARRQRAKDFESRRGKTKATGFKEISPHDEIKIMHDSSMSILASSLTPSNALSTAASRASSTNLAEQADPKPKPEEPEFKEWIPQFGTNYTYTCLFRFASAFDYTLMVIGTIAALCAGCCIPAIIYFFGNLIRTKVLVDKMGCVSGSTSLCDDFLGTCEENTVDASKYEDHVFLERPLPLNNVKITTTHMEEFIDLELAITFAYMLSSSIYFFCWNYASQNQGGKLRRAYFQSLLDKDMSWFDTVEDPELINRLMENTIRVVEATGESIPVSICLTVTCLLCIGLAFYHGWQLAMVCFSALPLILGSIWLVSVMKADRILKERRAYRVAHDLAKEVFSKIRTVIGYGTQLIERDFYERQLARGHWYIIRAMIWQSLSLASMYIVTFGMWAVVFWYGMELVLYDSTLVCTDRYRITEKFYDAGNMFIIIFSVIFGCSNVYIVMVVMGALSVAKSCCKEVLKVIDGPNGVESMDDEGIFLDGPLSGKVEFKDVRFTYPGNKRLALNNLSFVAEPNTTVAIVGLSNSGKSTTLKLICKEYLADSGFVEIDGHDIRKLNTKWLRAHVGYIPQEQALFDMSIEDNVRMGKLDANFFQIQEACIRAGAHDFIISFKEGYQTKIGHKGNRLTPGQKQQLSIARALIREPKILLLDEPTYALDSSAVIEFMRSLQKISEDRTVILVAHRLATVVYANMIYVLKNGRVVEKGDHQNLIKSKGAYSQLCAISRPSNSFHPGGVKIEGFDTSEMTIFSCVKTFSRKPILPNLYNNMLNVDPVVFRVTRAILASDKDTERGFHAKLEWTLADAPKLPDTPEEHANENVFGKMLRVDNLEATGSQASLDDSKDKRDIAEEYADISILNYHKRSWLRVLKMASTSPCLIGIGIISSILLSLGIPFFGFLLALIIDVLSSVPPYPRNWAWARYFHKSISFPSMISMAIAALGVYSGIFAGLQDFCLSLASHNSVQKMRRILYCSILEKDLSFFEEPKNTPIHLASVLFQDTDSIRHFTFGMYATLIQCICMLIVVSALCITHALSLTGYTLLFVAVVVGFNLTDGWLAKKQHGKTIYALQQMSKLILQVFQSKHVITVCQMEPHYLKEFTSVQRKSLGTNKSLSCVRIFTYGVSQSAVFWGFGFTLLLGMDRISQHSSTFLDVMINGFVMIFGLITLGTNLSVVMGFKHITKGGVRMLEILSRKPLLSRDEGLDIEEEDCTQAIEFVNAHFWRPQTPDSSLLKGVNLMISPMQLTAIVGYPESGKSAYLELLARYYDATGGLVTIAGKDIRHYSVNSLHQHLSVIPKEPELFRRTVAQNIALGAAFKKSTMNDVIKAAKEANVHNLIVSLPEGYETRMGGDHDYLSSAQKQKIAIARALLKNPKILIFDDITSLLDKEGESAVLESIKMIKSQRTVIMISHLIQPVQDADWIVVMEKGYLEEQGTHADLLKRRSSGVYAHMWRSQNPLQDENFLKGRVSLPGKSREKSERRLIREVVPPFQKQKVKPLSSSSPPPTRLSEETIKTDDPEVDTPMCGGLFNCFGLGVVELADNDDEYDLDDGDEDGEETTDVNEEENNEEKQKETGDMDQTDYDGAGGNSQ